MDYGGWEENAYRLKAPLANPKVTLSQDFLVLAVLNNLSSLKICGLPYQCEHLTNHFPLNHLQIRRQ